MALLDAPRRLARLRQGLAWHRRLGVLACGAIILWSLSGALHPLLSRYQPRPAGIAPPPLAALPVDAPSLARMLAAAGITEVKHARLVAMPAGTAWQVEVRGASALRYFAAGDGGEVADGERLHAEYLARHYLGETAAAIVEARRVSAFGGEYAWVNRLLPVWRVAFARSDGMRVYVEPRSAQLATLVDDRKALFNALFVYGHTWRIPGLPEGVRLVLAGLALCAVMLTPLAGLAVWLLRRGLPAPGGLRRLHRRLGLAVAAVVLASATSGAWHLAKGALDRAARRELPLRASPVLAAAALDTRGLAARTALLQSLRLVQHGGQVYARTVAAAAPATGSSAAGEHAGHGGHAGHAPPPTVGYLPLGAGPPLTDRDYAAGLAAALDPRCESAGDGLCDASRAAHGTLVERFGGDYGFVNKLLPVWRFEAGRNLLYVHPETGSLAARVAPADHAEGWSFANLHKWQALEFLGRWPRDLLQIGWALLSALTAGLGLRLLRGRRATGSGT